MGKVCPEPIKKSRFTFEHETPDGYQFFLDMGPLANADARHFKGRVHRYSIWNEPNHPQFLGPQYDSRHRPVSPGIYRNLYAAALRCDQPQRCGFFTRADSQPTRGRRPSLALALSAGLPHWPRLDTRGVHA